MFPLPVPRELDSPTLALQRRSRVPRVPVGGIEQSLSQNTKGMGVTTPNLRADRLRRPYVELTRVPTLPATLRVPTRRVTHVPPLPAQRKYPVRAMDFSKRDVGLPYGVPRVINAATLKRLAGGRSVDTLLKKTRAGWVFVPDAELIDLTDNSREYRLGRLTIFS